MLTPIILPQQGNTVETCLILEWKKKKGEEIKKGDIVCEIETDKAVFELESPADGILLETFFKEGDDVPVLTNIAVIGNRGERFDEYILGSIKTNIEEKKEGKEVENKLNHETVTVGNKSADKNNSIKEDSSLNKARISPRAKNLAEKFKLPIEKIKGTGPGNRIIERDVLAASKNHEYLTLAARDLVDETNSRPEKGSGIGNRINTADAKNKAQIYNLEEESVKVVPLRGIRKLIAERMLESLKNSAQLTLNSSADATALLDLRKRFKNSTLFKEFQICNN